MFSLLFCNYVRAVRFFMVERWIADDADIVTELMMLFDIMMMLMMLILWHQGDADTVTDLSKIGIAIIPPRKDRLAWKSLVFVTKVKTFKLDISSTFPPIIKGIWIKKVAALLVHSETAPGPNSILTCLTDPLMTRNPISQKNFIGLVLLVLWQNGAVKQNRYLLR